MTRVSLLHVPYSGDVQQVDKSQSGIKTTNMVYTLKESAFNTLTEGGSKLILMC